MHHVLCHVWEVCPVYIEHVPKIIEMRRHLVQMESKFPPELAEFIRKTWNSAATPGDRAV